MGVGTAAGFWNRGGGERCSVVFSGGAISVSRVSLIQTVGCISVMIFKSGGGGHDSP